MQILPLLLCRIVVAATTMPDPLGWTATGLLVLTLGAVALPLGRRMGFLRAETATLPTRMKALILSAALVSPALVEELIFRVMPIPRTDSGARLSWAFGSFGAFVLYHPVKTWLRPTLHNRVFADRRFLTLAGLLGFSCTAAYLRTGSLWPPVVLHWLAVSVWVLMLGGYDRVRGGGSKANESGQR